MTPLDIAKKHIGYTESPPNSNKTIFGSWYGMDGESWCMMFVQFCFYHAGNKLPYKTSSCSDLLRWYKNNQPQNLVTRPQPNDIVIYNFGHTGIVEKDNLDGTITVIEGNTSSNDKGSQSNGGGVYRRKRDKSKVSGYIRPYVFTEDDYMTDKEIYEAYNRHAKTLPLKLGTKTKAEFDEAVKEGITDGTNPNGAVTRWQAAVMALRAKKK